jgi:hypothetical protein
MGMPPTMTTDSLSTNLAALQSILEAQDMADLAQLLGE